MTLAAPNTKNELIFRQSIILDSQKVVNHGASMELGNMMVMPLCSSQIL